MTYTRLEVETMSRDQLDDIALLKNSVVGELTGTENLRRGKVSDFKVGDWGFHWVATKGSPKKGMLVLKPTNRRTKTLLVKGRCQYIKRKWKVPHAEAVALVEAMRGKQHVNEETLLSLIARSRHDAWWIPYVQEPELQDTIIENRSKDYPELKDMSKERLDIASKVVIKFQTSMEVVI